MYAEKEKPSFGYFVKILNENYELLDCKVITKKIEDSKRKKLIIDLISNGKGCLIPTPILCTEMQFNPSFYSLTGYSMIPY